MLGDVGFQRVLLIAWHYLLGVEVCAAAPTRHDDRLRILYNFTEAEAKGKDGGTRMEEYTAQRHISRCSSDN